MNGSQESIRMSAHMNNVELLVRGEPLLEGHITVTVPIEANKAMRAVIARAEKITVITDEQTHARASLIARELQGLRKGLETNYRAAKAPVLNAERALDGMYKELDGPLKDEYQRMDRLVSGYGEEQRREQARLDAARRAEECRIEEEAKAEVARLQRAKEEAELRARLEEDARAKKAAERQVNKLEEKIESVEVSAQIEKDSIPFPEPVLTRKPIGGRRWTEYTVKMTDETALFAARPDLVKVELREGMAKELAKSMDDKGIALDSIPGLQITKVSRTSFTGASRIRIHGD